MLKSVTISWIILFLAKTLLNAQPHTLLNRDLRFEHPEQELGLSQRSINCMIQDSDGYLWIGTWSGLLRYDGSSTQLYSANNQDSVALKSNKITTLYESSDSSIWVGTMVGGLFRFDKSEQRYYQYQVKENENTISDNNIWDVVEDKDGNIWIATQNGLNRMDAKTGRFKTWWHDPSDNNSLPYNFLTELHIDASNHLWVTTERGVVKADLTDGDQLKFERFYYSSDTSDEDLHNYVYDMTIWRSEGEELICWATKKGLKIFDGQRISSYEVPGKSSSFSFFRSIWLVGGANPFLLLGSEKGLSLFDITKKRFTHFFGDDDIKVNLSHNTVSSLLIDRSGVLWVGSKKGINKFDTYNNNFGLYLTKDFDSSNSIITGIVLDQNGHKWISTLGGGLFRLQNGEIKSYIIVDGENRDLANFIQKLSVDSDGMLWVGTAGAGIYVVDINQISGNQITKYQRFGANGPGSISDDYVMSLQNGMDGMWVGTWSKGLNHVSNKGVVINYREEWLENSPLVTLFQESKQTLWVGTRGKGLLKISLDEKTITGYERFVSSGAEHSLSNDFINTIYRDEEGQLWIGTEDGLNRFIPETKTFEIFKQGSDLKNAEVVAMLQDDQGKYWLTHNEGLTLFEQGVGAVNNFDTKDRIQGGFFYNEVSLKDKDGSIFFGGSNGLNYINPKEIFENPHLPNVVIQNFNVFGEPVLPNVPVNGRVIISKPINQLGSVELHHDESSFSLEFAALHFASPSKNQYAFRLDGYNNEWQYTDAARRFSNYTNLREGTYTFRVKASNDDGVWNNEEKKLKIIILPPWWRTTEAFVSYVFLAIILLMVFRKLILMRIQYENDLKLERIKRENTENLNKAKLQFFTNISHEFRTPLTLILGPLERLLNSGEAGPSVQNQLKLITHNAGRLQRLINQLLDFRKAEAGNLSLKVAEGNFYKFVKEIKLSFDNLASEQGIEFEFNSSSNVINVYFDRDQFEKVLYNLLSNAFKHTGRGGRVDLKLVEHDKHVEMVIEDSGVGIPESEISRVFDRFFIGENEKGSNSGIGLALSKNLVEMHHGSIDVHSKPDILTQFTVILPKGSDHFESDELLDNFRDSESIESYVIEMPKDLGEREYSKDVSELQKILIVEDNQQVRTFIKSLFQYDFVILEAENGEIGFDLATEENPDLIISDVMMPVMDGFSMCTRLKKNINTSHIPVILLTARTSYIYQVEGLEKGADDYITKPFSPEILILKVKNLLKSREQFRQLAQSGDSLAIEPKKITVTSADELFIIQAIEIVEENMSNSEYSVVEFGKEIGFSRMQLYRKLKAITGLSPNEFIRMLRVKRAAQLLEHGDFNVSEVTYQIGFTDPTYLRKCFKQQFGITPSDYAKQHKKGGN